MRPLTEQQQRILQHDAGYSVRGRVRIFGPDGTWHDLTNFFGRDFLEGVDVDESLDMPVGQATVRLMRSVRGLSLAPLMVASAANTLPGSYAPLLDPNRLFRVEVQLGFRGEYLGTWLPLFAGRIDSVDSGHPDTITFTGRDMGGVLQDVWTDEEKVYGSDAGVPLETVCNTILTDAQLSDFALYTPEASTQALGKYKQDYEPTQDALSKLAAARGWEVRWKLRPDTGDWGLWLWGPDRDATTPVWTYTASDYQYLGELRVGLEDVRTAVEVVYPDASDLDAAGQPKRKTVRRESATALARYGHLTSGGTRLHRLMRVTEGATTNLRSAAEAGRLADLALADLSTADVGASVEVGFHPGLELADLVSLAPNGINFSDEQRLAVRQVTHSLSSTTAKTTLRLLGKPSIGTAAWLCMESRAGIAPGAPFTGPAAPSGLAVTNSVTGAVLLFTAPSITSGGPPAEEYELHVDETPGFVLSNATLKGVSSSTRFDLTGLPAGTARYARVRSRDRKGNVGLASEEVALAPRYVAPSDMQPQVIYSSLTPNPSLEAWTRGPDFPPDAWSVSTGTWGTDFARSTTSYSGGYAVAVTSGTIGARLLASQYLSVSEGETYAAMLRYYQPTGSVGTTGARMELRWYNASFAEILASAVLIEGTEVGAWQLLSRHAKAPIGARYARLLIGRNPPASLDPVFLDMAAVDVYGPTQETPRPIASFYNSFSSSSAGDEGRAEFYRTSTGELQMQGAIVRPTGSLGAVRAFYLSEPPPVRRRFRVATASGGTVVVVVNEDGFVDVIGASAGDAIHLCQIRYRLS